MSLCDLLRHTLIVHIDTIDIPSALDAFLGYGHPITIPAQDDVIRTHLSLSHLPRLPVKRPVLETVRALPLHAVVPILVFIPELHGNLVVGEGKQFLAKTVVGFLLPLFREERDDLLGAHEEVVPVAPNRVGRVAVGNLFGVTGVPHVLGEFDFLPGCCEGEWRFEGGHPWRGKRLKTCLTYKEKGWTTTGRFGNEWLWYDEKKRLYRRCR